jgi:hypothetical protein
LVRINGGEPKPGLGQERLIGLCSEEREGQSVLADQLATLSEEVAFLEAVEIRLGPLHDLLEVLHPTSSE